MKKKKKKKYEYDGEYEALPPWFKILVWIFIIVALLTIFKYPITDALSWYPGRPWYAR